MKPSTRRTALMIATMTAALWSPSTWADDAHHPAQGAIAQIQTTPSPAPAAVSAATIKALQEALNKQGIAVKTDGVLNDETRAALKKYQTQHHLPVTGEPDKATLDKLGVVASRSAAAAPPPALAEAAPATPPAGGPPVTAPAQPAPPAPTQPGQTQGGMMMNCPMMPAMMQMMQGMMQMMQMMQGQMQPGQMQPGQMQPGQMQPRVR